MAVVLQRWCPAVLVVAIAVGCGGSAEGPVRIDVSGTVTLDGEPLAAGAIRFVPTGSTKGPKASAVIEQGAFEFSRQYGPVPGEHRIEIEATPPDLPDPDDAAGVVAYLSNSKQRRPVQQVPAVYNRHSQLEATVRLEGANEFHFELVSKN